MVFYFDKNRSVTCSGKTVVITGGSGIGIGFETAKELVIRGGNVIILCRNRQKTEKTVESIQSLKASGTIKGIEMDLQSFQSVRTAASQVLSSVDEIDICILNAGIMKVPLKLFESIESQQTVNHFSHFLLLNLLAEKICVNGRVISLSSEAHRTAKGNGQYWKTFANDDEYKKENEDPLASFTPYGESKLANMLHMRHLALLKPNLRCFSVHPGVVKTELSRYWKDNSFMFSFLSPLMSPFLKTPSQGAQTTLYCALSNELDDAKFNGKYFADGKECSPHNNFTYNEQNAKRAADLWKISEEITNSKLN